MLELLGVLGSNICSLAKKVLGTSDTPHPAVHVGIAEAAVDQDGATDGLSGGLQEHVAAIGHVHYVLHGGNVGRVFLQVAEFGQCKVWG